MASWNYPGGQYGQPAYGSYPGVYGAGNPNPPPPGMAPPPGMSAPPGVSQAPSSVSSRSGAFAPGFRQPPNMPNINFNAPILRLGLPHESSRGGSSRGSNAEPMTNRRGIGTDRGSEHQRQSHRESATLIPPTREELARTIFVSNISDGITDSHLERILRAAGNLRRWTRATDGENKPCTFGFAEYEDAESLETASEIFKELEVSVFKAKRATGRNGVVAGEDGVKSEEPNTVMHGDETKEESATGDVVQKTRLLVVVDEESRKYAAEWRERRNEDEATTQFRTDAGREALASTLASLANPISVIPQQEDSMMVDEDPYTQVKESYQTFQGAAGEFIPINPTEPEDELAEIPAEMRETVAAEIQAFRDRSIKRDLDRLKQEEEIEAEYRRKHKRGTSPLSAPSGPAGGANGVPLGPRGRGVDGAPSGPKSQMARDYKDSGRFVNGNKQSSLWEYIPKDDEENSDLDDWELEEYRREKKKAQQEIAFNEALRVWTKREHSKVSAIERETKRNNDENESFEKRKQAMSKMLKEFDDDTAGVKGEIYYFNHSQWLHNRGIALKRETREDHNDRRAEEHEKQREREKEARARGMADAFLNRMEIDLPTPVEPTRFKISLGSNPTKGALATAPEPRKTAFEMEGWLDDEELDAGPQKKRELKTLDLPALEETARLTEQERQKLLKQIAASIPSDTNALFEAEISWQHINEEIIEDNLQPVVEKNLMEILGVQEQMLVDVVLDHLRKHGTATELMTELRKVLEGDEAESLVKKLWRMVVFFSEREKRGL